jgi:multidrug transporter EmrE-like cation transporter
VWAFTNAGLFTLYIVLAHRIANADPASSPIDRLGASMMVAAIAIAPFGVLHAGAAFSDPAVLLAGIGVGITSSVIPYVFDQLAMARLARSTYALFIALLPATAVIIGVIVLAQIPHPIEIAAVGLVVIGVAIHKGASMNKPRATQFEESRHRKRWPSCGSAVVSLRCGLRPDHVGPQHAWWTDEQAFDRRQVLGVRRSRQECRRRLSVGVALECANDIGIIGIEHVGVRLMSIVRFYRGAQHLFPDGTNVVTTTVTHLVLN